MKYDELTLIKYIITSDNANRVNNRFGIYSRQTIVHPLGAEPDAMTDEIAYKVGITIRRIYEGLMAHFSHDSYTILICISSSSNLVPFC